MSFLNTISFDSLPVMVQELFVLFLVSVIIAFFLICPFTEAAKKVLDSYNRTGKRLPLFISLLLSLVFGAGFSSIFAFMETEQQHILLLKLVFYSLFSILVIFSFSYVFYKVVWKWFFLGIKLFTLYLQNLVKEAQFNRMQIRLEAVKVIKEIIKETEKRGLEDDSSN